jgi:hypothetical protein
MTLVFAGTSLELCKVNQKINHIIIVIILIIAKNKNDLSITRPYVLANFLATGSCELSGNIRWGKYTNIQADTTISLPARTESLR